ncbi:unnamed protein product [Urochloa humidicola]
MAVAEAKPRAQARLAAPAPTWSQRAEALTHILTHPSHSPSLHSQLLVASRVPCPPPGPTPYPPFLCPGGAGASLLRWALASVFLPRAARLGLPPSSWRSRCPFQLPPPLVPSSAIEPAPERWGYLLELFDTDRTTVGSCKFVLFAMIVVKNVTLFLVISLHKPLSVSIPYHINPH